MWYIVNSPLHWELYNVQRLQDCPPCCARCPPCCACCPLCCARCPLCCARCPPCCAPCPLFCAPCLLRCARCPVPCPDQACHAEGIRHWTRWTAATGFNACCRSCHPHAQQLDGCGSCSQPFLLQASRARWAMYFLITDQKVQLQGGWVATLQAA